MSQDNNKSHYIINCIFDSCDPNDVIQELEGDELRVIMEHCAIMPTWRYKELMYEAKSINPFPKIWRKLKNVAG